MDEGGRGLACNLRETAKLGPGDENLQLLSLSLKQEAKTLGLDKNCTFHATKTLPFPNSISNVNPSSMR